LIYDTFISPVASRDLLATAQALSGRPRCHILNSHYHNDHTWGNLGIPKSMDIISTFKTRKVLVERDPIEYQKYRQEATQSLGKMQALLESASNESQRSHAQYFVAYYQAILATLPLLPARLANILTQDVLEFTGNKRRARFIPLSGHTGSDAILHLPEENILFLADLLFVQAHPYFADGRPDQLCRAVADIKELKAPVLVPGHGPIGRMEDLDKNLEYLQEMQALVEQGIRAGLTWEQLANYPIPAKYSTWIFSNFYEENLQFLYQLGSANEAGAN
jgi:glyoxylase-like metal-dependent hydrolase (beta-lactamase superfamily II)